MLFEQNYRQNKTGKTDQDKPGGKFFKPLQPVPVPNHGLYNADRQSQSADVDDYSIESRLMLLRLSQALETSNELGKPNEDWEHWLRGLYSVLWQEESESEMLEKREK
jgi:hypothetical protein